MNEVSGRTGFRVLAYVSAGLALVGVVLPLVPTTPFVLLAAWFASKGSPAFAAWLEGHRHFGPVIENWRDRRVVPPRAKLLACGMLLLSWSLLLAMAAPPLLLLATGLFFTLLGGYLLTRPSC